MGPVSDLFSIFWSPSTVNEVQLYIVAPSFLHKLFWESFCATLDVHAHSGKIERLAKAMYVVFTCVLAKNRTRSGRDLC